jgi:hypothetical protein
MSDKWRELESEYEKEYARFDVKPPFVTWVAAIAVDTRKQIATLQAQIEAMREALEWYADEKNYGIDDWGVKGVINPPDYGKPGFKARAALARPEEKKDYSDDYLKYEREKKHE